MSDENICCPKCSKPMMQRAKGYACRRCGTYRPTKAAPPEAPKPEQAKPKGKYEHVFVAIKEAEAAQRQPQRFEERGIWGFPRMLEYITSATNTKPPEAEPEPTREEVMAKLSKGAWGGMAHRRKIERTFEPQMKPLHEQLEALETQYAHLRESIEGITPDEGALRDGIAMRLLDY
jgi:hypothetical protein